MHQPGKLVELRDRRDLVRALRWPWECIAAEDAGFRDALAYWQSKGYTLNAVGATMPTPPISELNKADISRKTN